MSNFDYITPIITTLRLGTPDSPYIDKVDTLTLDDNAKAILVELPVKFNGVQVSGNGVTWVEIQSGSPSENQYIVDYTNKIVTFHSSRKGLQLIFSYKGRGLIYVPTSMIYTSESNGVVTQTLDQVVAAAAEFRYIGPFDNSEIYSQFNIVTYQSSSYMYINTTSGSGHLPTDNNYWVKIAGNTNRGVYSTSTSYSAGDIVEDANYHNVYQSLQDNNLNNPLNDTDYWQLMVSVDDAIDLINTTNTNVTNAESARVVAENNRVSAENIRESNESTRQSNESVRQSNETSRVSAETNRVSAENDRETAEDNRANAESVRESNESTRQSNESTRQSNESSRTSAENDRVSAENSRVSAESVRVTTETGRVSAENDRVTQEGTRQSNESTRVSNESTRESNESTRQSQEQERQEGYAAFKLLEEYDNTHSYVPLNKVTYNGSTYQCILASTGNIPTNATYWIQIAAKGSDGTGVGTVTSVSSANSDISVANSTDTPVLTLNSGVGANQIPKRDANGNLQNIGNAVSNISSDTTLTLAQSGIINVTTDATNKTITLPDATTAQVVFTIKKADSGAGQVVINTTSSQTIDGVSSKILVNQYATITVVSSGGNWLVKVDNDNDKIGILSNLTTTDKSSLVSAVNEINDKLHENPPIITSLSMGVQKITVDQPTPLKISAKGQTRQNLVTHGDCEDLSKFTNGTGGTASLDTTQYTSGSNSVKITLSSTSGYIAMVGNGTVANGKKYVFLADVKNGNLTSGIELNLGGNALTNRVTDTTKWRIASGKFTATASASYAVNIWAYGSSGQYGNVDSIRLYEVSDAEYAEFDTLTEEQKAAKYPFVKGLQTVNGLYAIRKGKNLLPPFTEWTLHANAKIVEPYKIEHTSVGAGEQNYIDIPAIPAQSYSFSGLSAGIGRVNITALDKDKTSLDVLLDSESLNGTVTTPANTTYLRVYLYTGVSAGIYTFTNPILNLGSAALPFEPKNDDYQFFTDLNLASSIDGLVYDSLYTDNEGNYRKLAQFKVMELDGSLGWVFNADHTGHKSVYLGISTWNIKTSINQDTNNLVVKYDGKALKQDLVTAGSDVFNTYTSTMRLNISISDTDSGWGENYTPTSDEIKAYFWGWKMYNNDTNPDGSGTYNGSGTKGWAYRNAANTAWIGTLTLPTGPSAGGLAGNGVNTPYRLQYQLANAVDEPVTMEGAISLHEGENQLEIGVGAVVGETANTVWDPVAGRYRINTPNVTSSYTKYRVNTFVSVFKNGVRDASWQLPTSDLANGKLAQTTSDNYDHTAAYSVTYFALDTYKLTCNPVSLSAEYETNLASVVSQNVQGIADLSTQVSIIKNQYARKQQGQWIAPTLLNGWVNYGSVYHNVAYMKDEFGFVHVRGSVKDGVMTDATVIFVLPPGYRPISYYTFPAQSVKADLTDEVVGKVVVGNDGKVYYRQKAGVSNAMYTLDSICFRAEQ